MRSVTKVYKKYVVKSDDIVLDSDTLAIRSATVNVAPLFPGLGKNLFGCTPDMIFDLRPTDRFAANPTSHFLRLRMSRTSGTISYRVYNVNPTVGVNPWTISGNGSEIVNLAWYQGAVSSTPNLTQVPVPDWFRPNSTSGSVAFISFPVLMEVNDVLKVASLEIATTAKPAPLVIRIRADDFATNNAVIKFQATNGYTESTGYPDVDVDNAAY